MLFAIQSRQNIGIIMYSLIETFIIRQRYIILSTEIVLSQCKVALTDEDVRKECGWQAGLLLKFTRFIYIHIESLFTRQYMPVSSLWSYHRIAGWV